jgi:ABC-type nitrate/sulfonate/bicarbonate transport system substrate-binding protein
MAEAKGYYKQENLTVTFREGASDVNVPDELRSGRADLALMGLNTYAGEQAQGEPVVAVMVTFQNSPRVLFSLADSGIKKPQDMVGRKVGIKSVTWGNVINQMLTNAGVEPSKIITVPVKAAEMSKLYTGEVEVWSGFATSEPVEAQLAGHKVNIIYAADYGVGSYEELLVARQETVDQKSDVLARFVRATLKGWRYAIEHPDEAGEIIAQWQPKLSLDFHKLSMRALIPLVDTGKHPIGWIDAQRWRTALGKEYDPARPGYTMQFVEQAQK